jgi:hypothetical protein
MPSSIRRFDSGSLSWIKPRPQSFDSVSAPLPEYLRPDHAPPPPSLASCESPPVSFNSPDNGSRYPPPPSTDLSALEYFLKELYDDIGLSRDEHIQMREERNALQTERLEQVRMRQKEALVFENLRKNMERREEELARQLKEARDCEVALFEYDKPFVEQSLEGAKLTAPQSQGPGNAYILSGDRSLVGSTFAAFAADCRVSGLPFYDHEIAPRAEYCASFTSIF